MKKYRIIADKSYVPRWTFDEGTLLWMVDFGEDDQRNVARRIWSRAHLQLFKERINKDSVFFFVEVEE